MMKHHALTPSAPLPTDTREIDWADPTVVRDELVRASMELTNAISRHRSAWQAMVTYKQQREAGDRPWLPDNDRTWKLRTSDVSWWANEMTAQATTVTALIALRAI